MDIFLSFEIVVEIILFTIAGIGGVMTYILKDLRNPIKDAVLEMSKLRRDITENFLKQTEIDKRLQHLETKVNICEYCPSENEKHRRS